MKLAGLAIATALVVACASTTSPSLVNPDPVHGGQCGNGDELATLCHGPDVSWCCLDEETCGPESPNKAGGECWSDAPTFDPGSSTFAARAPGDGGARGHRVRVVQAQSR